MSVESWDPDSAPRHITSADLQRLLKAANALESPDFGLNGVEISDLAALARHPQVDWTPVAAGLDDAALVALVQLYTLAEKLPGWEAGAKSPVIVLAAQLRERGVYPEDLTAWIRANTDNRFLPYGNLMDRL
ncbi:MAG: hypothetical protein CMQ49_09485 [Gammaproteobacteria bacterium]|nr:hypothetical protein [Gammaproteobacteria bacterium]|tara:strand:+ start:9062 stop:9457 length:396 start_codon:yes stop_codon:yes gene_type:complete